MRALRLKSKTLLVAIVLLVAAAVVFATVNRANAGSQPVLRVYLCSAAQKPWKEIIQAFTKETGVRVEAVYGSSGSLLAQLRLAGGDIYAPAAPYYMEKAVKDGLVDASTVREAVLLYPVILVPSGNPAGIHSLEDLARPGVRVGLGEPSRVAVGRYAKQLLQQCGLWEKVRRNIVVYAKNVADLTNYVAMGAVDAAITWDVNHWWYPGKTEAIPIPEKCWESLGPSYIPIAVASSSKHPDLAKRFIEYVTRSPTARRIWLRYHYHPVLGDQRGMEQP